MNEKRFVCKSGYQNGDAVKITLNGITEDERLTPRMAVRAAKAAFGHRNGVTVESSEPYGYRIYPKSARKIEYKD